MANNLTSDALSIGMLIYLPTLETTKEEVLVYTVKAGDTLYGISKKFNISVDELKAINNLTNNTLSIGQMLYVSPKTNKVENEYTVVSGDTLYSIAKKFGVDVNTLKSVNKLNSNLLSIGETLIIPNNKKVEESKVVYTVKRGDTLYSIARTYNTSVDEIKRLNGLTNNNLSIGQNLLLPN